MAENDPIPQEEDIPPSPKSFLSLPAELQLVILEMAVTFPYTFHLVRPRASPNSRKKRKAEAEGRLKVDPLAILPAQPGTTRVSRAIRHDSLCMFYQCNDFMVPSIFTHGHDELSAWLRTAGATNRALMRSLWVLPAGSGRDASKGVSSRYDALPHLKSMRREHPVFSQFGGNIVRSVDTGVCMRHYVAFEWEEEEAEDVRVGMRRMFGDDDDE